MAFEAICLFIKMYSFGNRIVQPKFWMPLPGDRPFNKTMIINKEIVQETQMTIGNFRFVSYINPVSGLK